MDATGSRTDGSDSERSSYVEWAARLLVLYGSLALAASAVSVARGQTESSGLAFAFLHLALILGLYWGLVRLRRWAWWLGLVFAALELLFLVPLAASVLLSPEPVPGRGYAEAILWTLGSLMLAAFLGLMVRGHHEIRSGTSEAR